MPTGGIHATPGRAAGRPALGVNPSPTAGSDPATGAAGGLGKTAKSVDQSLQIATGSIASAPVWTLPNAERQARRTERMNLQRAAAKLLPGSRTANCLWAVASNANGVDVIHNASEARSRFAGLQTCGSVWACPCCSGTISDARRRELNDLLAWARASSFVPVLLTLTARHSHKDELRTLLERMKKAKQRLAQRREWRTLDLVGSVTATEVTGGGSNGWHPHFHVLMIIRSGCELDAVAAVETLRDAWAACLKGCDLSGTGAAFDVRGAAEAGNYVAKWGAAEELALGDRKKGRHGRTPFQLLQDHHDRGDDKAAALFVEFAKTFKGRRQLVWSRGLKSLAGIEEKADERIAEEDAKRAEEAKDETIMATFTPRQWRSLREHRAQVLQASEHSPEGFARYVKRITSRAGTGGNPQVSTLATPLPIAKVAPRATFEATLPEAFAYQNQHDAGHDPSMAGGSSRAMTSRVLVGPGGPS